MDNFSFGRLRFTFLVFFLTTSAFLFRLYSVQIVHGANYRKEATHQRIHVFIKPGERGQILDNQGNPLTENLSVPSLFVVPTEVQNREATASRLALLLSIKKSEILRQLKYKTSSFRWVKRKISEAQAKRIQLEKLPGVGLISETKRTYPRGSFAAPVVGFASLDLKGLWGIEHSLNSVLRGEKGKAVVEATPTGMALTDRYIQDIPPKNGSSVQLTLDSSLQFLAEKLASEATLTYQAKHASILVLELPSFDILAMAQFPTFDPNYFSDYPKENWRNYNISWTYEPGSTMKVFAIAAALAEKRVTATSTFNDPGFLRVGKYTIRDAHNERHGIVTPRDIIVHSCNVGAAQVGLRTGQAILARYYQDFGFGKKTGVHLPGEEGGIFRVNRRWAAVHIANITFGQGIAVTPLQLITAYGALANGGKWQPPKIVDRIITPEGKTRTLPQKSARQVVPAAIAQEILSAMEGVVEEGTGKNAKIAGYRIAGKTGTAQKAIGGSYHSDKFVASFIGTFPLPNPRWVVLVIVDEPQGIAYGGEVAAPYFTQMAKAILRQFGIPPASPLAQAKAEQRLANALKADEAH